MSRLVSILIPTLNGGAMLERLLQGIADQTTEVDTEVLAIDSGSTDNTLAILQKHRVTTESLASRPFNHGDTRNELLKRARGELAVLIVQDAVPAHREWLHELVRPLFDDPLLAGTYARQQPWPQASRVTAHYLARWAAAAPRARVTDPMTSQDLAALSPAERHIACAFDNVCSCIRMSVWRAHPFRTTPIAEDLEWARDVLTAGYRLAYVPASVVWHSHERPVRYELHRTYRVHQRLQALFGLSTIPDVPSLVRAVCSTLPLHVRLAAAEPAGRPYALLRGAGLAFALPLGQYLGARAAREGRELLDVGDV